MATREQVDAVLDCLKDAERARQRKAVSIFLDELAKPEPTRGPVGPEQWVMQPKENRT